MSAATASSGIEAPIEWSALDLAFGRFLRDREGSAHASILAQSGRLLSRQRALGHSRLRLRDWAGRAGLPALDRWQEALRQSRLVSDGRTPAPLVFDGEDTLCLYRYWLAERRLAEHLLRLHAIPAQDDLPSSFFTHFPQAAGAEPDWQAIAAAAALRNRLTVITGGPGTGKTTVVARILSLLREREPQLRIQLAAPTGKAAARLAESLAAHGHPFPVRTLHALLGSSHGGFRHNAQRPLEAQALIVDETSMADLLLLLAFFEAVPDGCRVILLGDSGQLASVETGCVLADISAAGGTLSHDLIRFLQQHRITLPDEAACGASPVASSAPAACTSLTAPAKGRRKKTAESGAQQLSLFAAPPPKPVKAGETDRAEAPLSGAVIELRKNWRFADRPGIGRVAAALRRGEDPLPLPQPCPDVCLLPPEESGLRGFLTPLVQQLGALRAPADALAALSRQRVLCATRQGEWGVARVNLLARSLTGVGRQQRYYAGMPILVEKNDYRLGVMNGDSGICLPDAEGALRVWFADGRCFAPEALPDHSESWALTIHKSQGSEFDEVLLLLPEDNALGLCRELVYTGVTRARKRLSILAEAGVLAAAAARPATRASGLQTMLAAPAANRAPSSAP